MSISHAVTQARKTAELANKFHKQLAKTWEALDDVYHNTSFRTAEQSDYVKDLAAYYEGTFHEFTDLVMELEEAEADVEEAL